MPSTAQLEKAQECRSSSPQLPVRQPDFSSPQNKAPHCSGKNGKESVTEQPEPSRESVSAPTACADPDFGWFRGSPADPADVQQFPVFPTCPDFCAGVSRGFLPRCKCHPGEQLLAGKGAPKIVWRVPCLAELRGSLETRFSPMGNKIRVPLLTAGPKNEPGIWRGMIAALLRMGWGHGDTELCCPHRPALHACALLGDRGDF